MKNCCICKQAFKEAELDFLERCEPCFHKWIETPVDDRPKIGVPYVPIYNGDINNRYKS